MRPLPPPIPDALRPRPVRRQHRRTLAVLLVPALLATLPMWRLRTVTVTPCPGLPSATVASLTNLVGTPLVALDLHWVRHQVVQWPALAGAEVRLELPGTLRVAPQAAVAAASVAVGRGWHAVTVDGALAGRLDAPLPPLLEGFRDEPAARAAGLAAAARLARATGRRALSVRAVLPDDLEVVLAAAGDGPPLVAHVTPEGSPAEGAFAALLADGTITAGWADLRLADRMVVGGAT